MNPILKVSAAVLIAAMSVVPALAAVDSASVVMGTSSGMAPVADLTKLIGTWNKGEINALVKASKVTVFDTKTLYDAADEKLVGEADMSAGLKLTEFRAALTQNSALRDWFTKNKLSIGDVIAVTDTGHQVDLYLN